MIPRLMTSAIAFVGGMVTAINLNFLLEPVGTDYNAQWWKVIGAITVAVVIPILDHHSERW